jgi:dGTPase
MVERAIYASYPEFSRGRVFEPGPSATRSEFQRDRDRIIHSTAFRRLQHKTQVFLQHEGQHFRTRLTHTLEVSQISRSMARALGLDEDLAEAVALAHDLGHTPFGHAGERVLDSKMEDLGGFDHNVQALRVVTLLENRYAAHDGLNLTWETLEGIFKHNGPVKNPPTQLADIPVPADLMPDTYASLEAQAAAIADDIAYNAHDIDDALRAGLLTFEQLAEVPLVGEIVREVLGLWPDIGRSRQAHEVQRRLITRSIENAIVTSSSAIARLDPQSADDVRNAGETLIRLSPGMAEAEKGLKQFLFDNVYRAETVMAPVRESEAVVAALFDHYLDNADMPEDWGAAARAAPNRSARARIVSDFIAGMTDPYALDQYAALFDARPDFR